VDEIASVTGGEDEPEAGDAEQHEPVRSFKTPVR
jgi:hypothetical protein